MKCAGAVLTLFGINSVSNQTFAQKAKLLMYLTSKMAEMVVCSNLGTYDCMTVKIM